MSAAAASAAAVNYTSSTGVRSSKFRNIVSSSHLLLRSISFSKFNSSLLRWKKSRRLLLVPRAAAPDNHDGDEDETQLQPSSATKALVRNGDAIFSDHSKWSSSSRRRRVVTCKSKNIVKISSFDVLISRYSVALIGFLTAGAVLSSVSAAAAAVAADAIREPPAETLSNIPQTLSSAECKKAKIQRPKSRKAESCTIKCVTTCIRGGEGEGPLNVRRPLVVFKQGFRTRQYCLVECSDICNLIGDTNYEP